MQKKAIKFGESRLRFKVTLASS